ncbi:MAG: hypothetical protein AABN95_08380 [Acidobacteriota bacterium]
MFFRTKKVLHELDVDFGDGQSIEFVFTRPHPATVSVRQASAEEEQLGYKKYTAFCTVNINLVASAEATAMFESLANNKLPKGSKKPDRWDDSIDQSGEISPNYVVPLHLLPDVAQNLSNDAYQKMSVLASNTLTILRWRYGLTGTHNPVRAGGLAEWSFDSEHWNPLPTSTSVEMLALRHLKVTAERNAEVVALAEGKMNEPLAHALYREAWEQRMSNPRSALVLGMVAAEVGFKQCVGELLPEARWLVDNVPSPPIVSMIRNYLPLLPTKLKINGVVAPPPKEIIRSLQRIKN